MQELEEMEELGELEKNKIISCEKEHPVFNPHPEKGVCLAKVMGEFFKKKEEIPKGEFFIELGGGIVRKGYTTHDLDWTIFSDKLVGEPVGKTEEWLEENKEKVSKIERTLDDIGKKEELDTDFFFQTNPHPARFRLWENGKLTREFKRDFKEIMEKG